jgi:hypothetical protein
MLGRIVQGVGQSVAAAAGTVAYIAGLVVLVGVTAHALTWILTRRRTVRWVWSYWNALGSTMLVAGLAVLGYGWLAFGLQTSPGSVLVGVGLLLLSAGLWMLIPV